MLKSFHFPNIFEQVTDWFAMKNPMNGNHYSYFDSLNKYKELNSYGDIYDKNISRRKVSTDVKMEYSKHIHFGTSFKEVKKLMPSRTFQTSFNSYGLYRKVLLYRMKLNGQNVKIEMHFYKNQLFFYKYVFSYAKSAERTEIAKAIIDKYNLPNLDLTSHSIFDSENNCIQVDDYLELSINYTQMNNPIFNTIDNLKQQSHQKMVANYNNKAHALFSSL